MKRLAAILLIGIFLFNYGGYRMLTAYQANKADVQWEERMDNNKYDRSQLVTFKIPLNRLPAYANPGGFERINGQIVIGKITYQYVERRIYNDSLELRCVVNDDAMKWKDIQNEFFRMFNDLAPYGLQSSQSPKNTNPHPVSFKNFSPDYLIPGNLLLSWNSSKAHSEKAFPSNEPICSRTSGLTDPPPEKKA